MEKNSMVTRVGRKEQGSDHRKTILTLTIYVVNPCSRKEQRVLSSNKSITIYCGGGHKGLNKFNKFPSGGSFYFKYF